MVKIKYRGIVYDLSKVPDPRKAIKKIFNKKKVEESSKKPEQPQEDQTCHSLVTPLTTYSPESRLRSKTNPRMKPRRMFGAGTGPKPPKREEPEPDIESEPEFLEDQEQDVAMDLSLRQWLMPTQNPKPSELNPLPLDAAILFLENRAKRLRSDSGEESDDELSDESDEHFEVCTPGYTKTPVKKSAAAAGMDEESPLPPPAKKAKKSPSVSSYSYYTTSYKL